MLQTIEIKNFALITELHLNLGPGVNVFTGETGAGKSILLDALSFLLGARANPDWIRSGCERMSVGGTFLLAAGERLHRVLRELQLMSDGEDQEEEQGELEGYRLVHIWRELQLHGRSQARINGMPVTAAALKTLGAELLEMQGQQEILTLLQPRQHLGILDQFGDIEHQQALRAYQQFYATWKAKDLEFHQLSEAEREANRSEDLWRFQHGEIEEVHLKVGEDEILEQRRQVLQSVTRLQECVGAALNVLLHDEEDSVSASTQLYQARRELEVAQRYDDRFDPWIENINSLYYQVEELGRDLASYLTELEADPGELDEIEERLEQIRKLKRKYGATIPEILQYQQEVLQKLESLERHEERLKHIERERETALQELREAMQLVTDSRQRVAIGLETALETNLAQLVMPECRFKVQFTAHQGPQPWQANGGENCEFLIAPNPGEPLKPLARIASGGELARILLALKTALMALEAPDIMVFDEPDSGLSGTAIKAMANALAHLSARCQLLLVTHQAVVAAVARQHYYIYKKVENEQTYTYVECLDRAGRLQEMLRLLAADNSSAPARRHAEELLEAGAQLLTQKGSLNV